MAEPKITEINIFEAIHHICAGKNLDRDDVLEIIKESLLAAYKKTYGHDDNVEVILDKDHSEPFLEASRKVVEKVEDSALEISFDLARKKGFEDINLGDEIKVKVLPTEFSRVATTLSKNVVMQKLKEMERNKVFDEFKLKEGELIHGYFQWARGDTIFVDIGNAEGVMQKKHQMPNERYRQGDSIKAIIHSVDVDNRGLRILLSRATAEFAKKLFELEIPEIYDGIVEIVYIARRAGIRTKVIVKSNREDVDPVGACVGMRGVRINSIVRELGNERIDVIQYSSDPEELIISAMTPANIQQIKIDNEKRETVCIVKDDEFPQAIGRDGSNVQLASQVTGYRIDLKTESEFAEFISSPEARAELDALFSSEKAEEEVETEEEELEFEGTALDEIPGLTNRVIQILNAGEIYSVEDLVETSFEDIQEIKGMTKNTAEQIMKLLAEVIEFEE